MYDCCLAVLVGCLFLAASILRFAVFCCSLDVPLFDLCLFWSFWGCLLVAFWLRSARVLVVFWLTLVCLCACPGCSLAAACHIYLNCADACCLLSGCFLGLFGCSCWLLLGWLIGSWLLLVYVLIDPW